MFNHGTILRVTNQGEIATIFRKRNLSGATIKPISKSERTVVNVENAAFRPWINQDGSDSGTSILQLNTDHADGVGFYLYKMAPGTTTEAHEHVGHEEFYIIEGDLTDNDGVAYRQGDMVLLKSGTQHNSTTKNGCLIAVFAPDGERSV